MSAIQTATERADGGQAGLARKLGVSPQTVNQWVRGERPVPRDHCPAIEAETGVRCEELLPDVVWTRDATGQVTGYHVPLQKAS